MTSASDFRGLQLHPGGAFVAATAHTERDRVAAGAARAAGADHAHRLLVQQLAVPHRGRRAAAVRGARLADGRLLAPRQRPGAAAGQLAGRAAAAPPRARAARLLPGQPGAAVRAARRLHRRSRLHDADAARRLQAFAAAGVVAVRRLRRRRARRAAHRKPPDARAARSLRGGGAHRRGGG